MALGGFCVGIIHVCLFSLFYHPVLGGGVVRDLVSEFLSFRIRIHELLLVVADGLLQLLFKDALDGYAILHRRHHETADIPYHRASLGNIGICVQRIVFPVYAKRFLTGGISLQSLIFYCEGQISPLSVYNVFVGHSQQSTLRGNRIEIRSLLLHIINDVLIVKGLLLFLISELELCLQYAAEILPLC